jgi:hypothetical protein
MPNESDDEYVDENGNRRRDNWENITKDWDGDGEFDFAPRIKLTIERYRLPLGRSIHRELDAEGNIKSLGGLSPDIEVSAKRRETWRLREMRRIQDTRVLRKWVTERFVGREDVFKTLAFCDFDNSELYPGFDDLYGSLDTTLTRDDVRFLLRIEVRRRVQDERGRSAAPGCGRGCPQQEGPQDPGHPGVRGNVRRPDANGRFGSGCGPAVSSVGRWWQR